MKKFRAFVIIGIVSMGMITMSGLLVPSTYAFTDCRAIIMSIPTGADVYINGKLMGKTPYLHVVGSPFSADIIVEMEGFETWTETIEVGSFEFKQVNAELTPLQAINGEPEIVTKTVTSTVTTTSPTTITSTTTLTPNTITITTVTTSTVISEVTEQIGLPAVVSYSAIGVAVIAVVIVIATRKRS